MAGLARYISRWERTEVLSRRRWWKVVDPLFVPRYLYLGAGDETMERLYKARGLIGFAIILAAAIHYQGARGIPATFDDWTNSLILITAAGFIGVIVVGAALVAATFPGRRRAAAWQLRWPLLTFLSLGGLFLLVFGPIKLAQAEHWVKPGKSWITGIFLLFVCIPFLIGATGWLCRGVYLCAVGFCRAADGHPLLPPLIAPLATGAWAIRSLFFAKDGGGMPGELHLILVTCGPLSIMLLSCVEIARLRRSPYFPFRQGPPQLTTAVADDGLATVYGVRYQAGSAAGRPKTL